MKLIMLGAVLSVVLSGCDYGGCVTRQEAARALLERDRALNILAVALKELQVMHPTPTPTITPKGAMK